MFTRRNWKARSTCAHASSAISRQVRSVRFLDRLDLIALKMFAALDPAKGCRHVEDLVAINPSREEVRHGLRRMSTWTTCPQFEAALHNLAKSIDCGVAIRTGHERATVVNDLMMASIDGSPVNGRTATNSV